MWLDALRAKHDGVGKMVGREEFDQLLGHCQVCRSSRFVAYCIYVCMLTGTPRLSRTCLPLTSPLSLSKPTLMQKSF
jgi:hypothetical protein